MKGYLGALAPNDTYDRALQQLNISTPTIDLLTPAAPAAQNIPSQDCPDCGTNAGSVTSTSILQPSTGGPGPTSNGQPQVMLSTGGGQVNTSAPVPPAGNQGILDGNFSFTLAGKTYSFSKKKAVYYSAGILSGLILLTMVIKHHHGQ